MRTNLSWSQATATTLTEPRRRSPTNALAHMAAGLAVAAITAAYGSSAARAAEATNVSQTGCHRVDEVKSSMFPNQEIVAYDFKGSDAGKLKRAMDVVSKTSAPDAVLVRLVLVPSTGDAFAFQFGADGCATATFMGLDFARMWKVFDTAGVHAPFGPTYYQMTGQAI